MDMLTEDYSMAPLLTQYWNIGVTIQVRCYGNQDFRSGSAWIRIVYENWVRIGSALE